MMVKYKNCLNCGIVYSVRADKYDRSKFCSKSCAMSYRNKQNTDIKNPNWKEYISKNNYHYKKIQVERYPEKIKARKKVNYALKTGKLIKENCFICGSNTDIQAHHEDYNKPLKVMWLCAKCHREIHE